MPAQTTKKGHGGERAGAGRKSKAEKFGPQINKAEKRIADKLPLLIDNMLHLAEGGYERVKEKFELGEVRDEKGRIVRDDKGDPLMQLVVVERTVEIADKDRAANIYLIDRILGKPTEHQEVVGGDTKVVINIAPQDVNYRTAASPLAPRPVGDSGSPGQDQSPGDGAKVG
jgi:hypothetical protein